MHTEKCKIMCICCFNSEGKKSYQPTLPVCADVYTEILSEVISLSYCIRANKKHTKLQTVFKTSGQHQLHLNVMR